MYIFYKVTKKTGIAQKNRYRLFLSVAGHFIDADCSHQNQDKKE